MKDRTVRQVALTAALLLSAAMLCSCAQGQTDADGPTDRSEQALAVGSPSAPPRVSVIDLVGKLIAVLALGWGAVQAVRWWQGVRGAGLLGGAPAGRRMCVEETLSLGADGRLHLLAVDGRRLLLAGAAEGLRLLADLTPPAEEGTPSIYRSRRQRVDGGVDELNILQAPVSRRPLRADLARGCEDWHARRDQLLRELQVS